MKNICDDNILNRLKEVDRSNPTSKQFLKEVLRVLVKKGYFIARKDELCTYTNLVEYSLHRKVWGEVADNDFYAVTHDDRVASNTLLKMNKLYYIWQSLLNTRSLDLPTMEVGVYKGGGSAFIMLAKEKILHSSALHFAVDTFSGHNELDVTGVDMHKAKNFNDTSCSVVTELLSSITNKFQICVGRYEDVQPILSRELFSFVHLDVDLYFPTVQYLEFLKSSLAVGGIIVIDDYLAPKCPGVFKSVNAFLKDNINIFQAWTPPTEQVILVKVKNTSGFSITK